MFMFIALTSRENSKEASAQIQSQWLDGHHITSTTIIR